MNEQFDSRFLNLDIGKLTKHINYINTWHINKSGFASYKDKIIIHGKYRTMDKREIYLIKQIIKVLQDNKMNTMKQLIYEFYYNTPSIKKLINKLYAIL